MSWALWLAVLAALPVAYLLIVIIAGFITGAFNALTGRERRV